MSIHTSISILIVFVTYGWNSLPDLAVDAPSVTAFRRLLDRVDLVKYCA